MENLAKYISELLCEHDCVIIPNFGGFVARPVSAQFSKTGNMLLPPGKSLVFNKNLSNNDGLLAGYVMQKHELQFKEAVAKIDQWVFDFRRQLETTKRLELENTGLLYYSTENALLFEPALQKSHEINSFGLVAVNAVKITNENDTFVKEKVLVNRTLQPKTSGNKTLMRVSIAVSSVLLFAFLILITAKQLPISNALASLNPFASKAPVYTSTNYKLGKLLKSSEKKIINETKTSTSFKLSENSAKTFVVKPDTVHSDKTIVIKTKHLVSDNTTSFAGPFQIVVGCFAVENNANRLIKQLKSQHIEASIVGQNPKGLYIVSVAGFTSEILARNKLNGVKQNYPSAWMMVR